MKTLAKLLLVAVAVLVGARFLPGVHVDTFATAIVLVVVLGLLNITLRPVLLLLSLPITLLTLGLFALVINAAMVLLAAGILEGFVVAGFWSALLFSFFVSLANGIADWIVE